MSKTLVLYFSMTGNTKRVAQKIAHRLQADTYEIQAQVPYSQADLTWTNDTCRANQEQNDPKSRPAFAGSLPDLSGYDTIIIGHPIWWGIPPRIIQTVLDKLNLTGKTIASFATSGGSIYAQAQELLTQEVGKNLLPGRVLSSDASIASWLQTWA